MCDLTQIAYRIHSLYRKNKNGGCKNTTAVFVLNSIDIPFKEDGIVHQFFNHFSAPYFYSTPCIPIKSRRSPKLLLYCA